MSTAHRVSVPKVLRFVWGYWRQLPFRFAFIVLGSATAVVLEILIPDRAAELMSALEAFASGDGSIDPAWVAFLQLVGIYFRHSRREPGVSARVDVFRF